MKTKIDPRIQARRKVVREHGARRGLRRMIGWTLMLAVVGGMVWFYQSEHLDVDNIVVAGAVESDPVAALAANGITRDEPMLLARVRAGRAETAIKDDPWVRDAVVRVQLPDTISVEVIEHLPAAWVDSLDGWLLVSPDGVVLLKTPTPGTALPHVGVGVGVVEAGSTLDDAALLGALEFAAALPDAYRQGVTIEYVDTELWADVDGHVVRLGRARSMVDKALAIAALLEHGIEDGAEVNLVAPTRPAVVPMETSPEPLVEEEG